jgi:hypothetical protein
MGAKNNENNGWSRIYFELLPRFNIFMKIFSKR